MKISKNDAYTWFSFFAALPEGEELSANQQEIALAVLAQIETATEARRTKLMAEIKGLKTLKNRTFYVGEDSKFPKGCRSCLLGTGLTSIRKTNTCNLECKFCYNYGEMEDIAPVGEGMWEIGGTKYYEKDIDLLLSIHKHPTGVAYVYLEPFMEIEKYYGIIGKFHSAGVYQHLYTNGTLATEETLKALGEAGLDELRLNLGASGCADKVIENIRIAKKYIPHVGIETPMTPPLFETFLRKKEFILGAKPDFMNCAELHLNANNMVNYAGANMYMARQGYLSPVWSRELTLQLMKIADEEKWDMVVHDCSNDTKFARNLNLSAKEGKWFGASNYGSEFDQIPFAAFLPLLQDESFPFVEEEELPAGFRVGELLF